MTHQPHPVVSKEVPKMNTLQKIHCKGSGNVQQGAQLLLFFGPLPDFPGPFPPPELGPAVQPFGVTAALLANNEIVQVIEILRRLLKQQHLGHERIALGHGGDVRGLIFSGDVRGLLFCP